jgi:alkanesulfonate monooxygenase SsuD/methylene tetrahydromethanopterin reductase-like flavin-dependent oxidoreductase (luciferase family)
MQFSMLFEMQTSPPSRELERQIFFDSVAQAKLADALGYDRIWVVEHHGLYEYSHSSAPEVFLSYVAALTKNIRLGHGVTLTPRPYNHPIRIAERIAALDILSNGRVDWGSGKSGSRVEQEGFGVNKETLMDEWEEGLHMIPQMWQKDIFEWDGRFYKIPPIQVIPKPVQNPHPPIFSACSATSTILKAASLGIGVLNFAQGNDAFLSKKVSAYREAFDKSPATTYKKNNHFAITPSAFVLNNDNKACEYGFQGSRFFGQMLSKYYLEDARPVGKIDINRDPLTPDELKAAKNSRGAGSPLLSIIGDPIAAREAISRFQETGVDEIVLILQLGGIPSELVLESIKVIGEKVIPHFK